MERKPKRRAGILRAVLILIIIAVLGTLLGMNIFTIDKVEIEGLKEKTYEEVFSQSGIHIGDNIWRVNLQKTEEGLLGNAYIKNVIIDRKLPSTIHIQVEERQMRAIVQYYRNTVLLDETGYVIEVKSFLDSVIDVPVITGMSIEGVEIGKPIDAVDDMQIIAMNAVLGELYQQNAIGYISELNVSNLDNLYLVSREGIEVQLGNRENMQAKIGWMCATMPALMADGYTSGVLDVTSGKYADFRKVTLPDESENATDGDDPDAANGDGANQDATGGAEGTQTPEDGNGEE